MKRTFVLALIMLFLSCWGFSQHIERLSKAEIEANETPRAAAYSFVTSVITENYAQTVELMTLGLFFELMPDLFGEGIPINQLFSTEYMHDIVDMRPVVKLGYEVVIVASQDINSEEYFEEGSKYRGQPAYAFKFDCADANNKFYDGSQVQYDTDVTVMVVKEEGKWKVFGFK